ncbi:hypothetical protein BVRB_035480 [Beta vulgaris subsp. vulgaris]|uniref:Uncharacterized protein n=1 Tax=Beta vulgaris subsp. vulgaris TaxID=3555 RepID=A0A0J7YPP0_BETVV|nr:hypothetical protein BVRB_035480 [Beta vulgaris subsp. vulgaris]
MISSNNLRPIAPECGGRSSERSKKRPNTDQVQLWHTPSDVTLPSKPPAHHRIAAASRRALAYHVIKTAIKLELSNRRHRR